MHPMILVSSASRPEPTTPNPVARCPVAGFPPSPWGDRFLYYTPHPKVIEAQQEIAKALKEEIKKELLLVAEKPLIQQLRLIDSIEGLGVAYHFDEEIEDALRRILDMSIDSSSDDLFLTSLRFRLLRQHGFKVSSDVFKKFISSDGSLEEEVASVDVRGLLSLYEACHVRVHGDNILDEVLPITMLKLKSMEGQVSNPSLKERITHALKMALHKRLAHLECVRYMQVYEEDDPLHNNTLLNFAKIDFKLLQASHKHELREMCRWGKSIDMPSKLPSRDRIVESYFWASNSYIEPQYSVARKISTMGSQIITSIDDIYDSYATLGELEIFTEAIYRWDKSCLDQLSGELRWFYQTLILDAHDEMERYLAPIGRSRYVHYAKQEIKALVRTYLSEARWRIKKYIPTLDEYMANDLYRNIGYVASVAYIFLGMDMATEHEFEWLRSLPTLIKSMCYRLRILNDIGGKKFDENKGISALFLECYMKEYGLSYEQACEELNEKTNELWKDVNECLIRPTEVPRPVINCLLNMTRIPEVIYDDGEDGFTLANDNMKRYINTLFVDSIPM